MEKSFDCRMALNVLQKNKPFNYYIDLLKELKLPKLTDDSILIIDKYAKLSEKTKMRLKDTQFKSNRNKKRYENKNKKYIDTQLDHITRYKELKITDDEIDEIVKSFKPIKTKVTNMIKNKLNDKSLISIDKKMSQYLNEIENSDNEEDENESDSSSDNDLIMKPNAEINAGLKNLNNTCYINAALQTFFQLPFLDELFGKLPTDEVDIISKLENLFYALKNESSVYNPIDFITAYKK